MSRRPSNFSRWHRLSAWAALIGWCTLIFVLSAQPGLAIAHGTLDLVLRKSAHVAEFAVLTVLAALAARLEGLSRRATWLWAAAFALAYAISDEWHQTFVHDRVGSPVDVAIDAVGIALALGGASMVRRSRRTGGAMSSPAEAGTP